MNAVELEVAAMVPELVPVCDIRCWRSGSGMQRMAET